MELWDLFDKNRLPLGKTISRGEKMPVGAYRTVVHICIFNSNGEMLIQHRQPFKKGFPNMWDVSVGGSAIAGETSAEAAEREASEELGISLPLKGTRPRLTVNFSEGFDDIYIVEKDLDISS
ncbi:MAG: NUDIX domain-containing protein, partial [Clostridia bacterium]|nr:NUDIX domain-containing protein [Clostridia bacterium]